MSKQIFQGIVPVAMELFKTSKKKYRPVQVGIYHHLAESPDVYDMIGYTSTANMLNAKHERFASLQQTVLFTPLDSKCDSDISVNRYSIVSTDEFENAVISASGSTPAAGLLLTTMYPNKKKLLVANVSMKNNGEYILPVMLMMDDEIDVLLGAYNKVLDGKVSYSNALNTIYNVYTKMINVKDLYAVLELYVSQSLCYEHRQLLGETPPMLLLAEQVMAEQGNCDMSSDMIALSSKLGGEYKRITMDRDYYAQPTPFELWFMAYIQEAHPDNVLFNSHMATLFYPHTIIQLADDVLERLQPLTKRLPSWVTEYMYKEELCVN